MNAILSATHIPLSTYIVATAISLIKLTLHVYIGSTLSTLTGGDGGDTDPEKDPNNHGKRVKVLLMVMGIILGIGVGAYVWAVAKREIAITEAARMERRQRRRRGGRGGGGRGLLANNGDGSGGGIELSDQHGGYIPDVDLTNRNSVDGFISGAASGRGGEGQDLSDANYFVGGAGNESSRYQDYEDDGDHEGNSLFGTGRRSQQQRQQQQGDWRNVGAAGAGHSDSSTDSDQSDYFDDSDDEDDEEGDLERGYGLGLDLNGDDRTGGRGDDGGLGEGEDEALDFSAHQAGLVDSPWQDDGDEGGEDDSHELLGGGEGRGGSGTRGR